MEISVARVLPNDDMEIEVTVTFFDETKSPHFSARVTVFIEQKNYDLAELKTVAITKAKEFLSSIA